MQWKSAVHTALAGIVIQQKVWTSLRYKTDAGYIEVTGFDRFLYQLLHSNSVCQGNVLEQSSLLNSLITV